ncbi:MAG: shikimate kinase [Candidatus Buchananbacteria bacterium]
MKKADYKNLSNIISNSKRINIVGSSGCGKSTFGNNLAMALNFPFIEMDQIFWGPNWYYPPDEEFFPKLENRLSGESWVLDGNYTRTIPIKWKNIQTVIWLDYSIFRIIFQAFKRAILRIISKKEFWPGTGNIETFKRSFLSKNSIILWSLSNLFKVKRKYNKIMTNPKYSYIKFIKLKSPRVANILLKNILNKNTA